MHLKGSKRERERERERERGSLNEISSHYPRRKIF